MRVFSSSLWSVLVIIGLGIPAFGQDPPPVSISGPILGFIQDSSGASIQPILGVLGASVLGPAVPLGSDVRNAIISPNQDYAIGVRGDNAEAVVIRLGSESVAINPLVGTRAGVGVVAMSPAGTALALYGPESKIFQSVIRFAEAPEIVFEFDASDISGSLRSMAVSDDGKVALLNFADGDNAALWVVSASGFR